MTINQFIALCTELTIDFNIALENDDVVGAIESENDALVHELLITLF
jgi:hypothetical protein